MSARLTAHGIIFPTSSQVQLQLNSSPVKRNLIIVLCGTVESLVVQRVFCPDRFELQVKKHAPRVTLFEKDHPLFCEWIEAAHVCNATFPVDFHLKHTCTFDKIPEAIVDAVPTPPTPASSNENSGQS